MVVVVVGFVVVVVVVVVGVGDIFCMAWHSCDPLSITQPRLKTC